MTGGSEPGSGERAAGLFGQAVPQHSRAQSSRLGEGEALCAVAPERGVQGELTYRCPPGVGVGERVEIPLGRSTTHGVVTRVGDERMAGDIPLKSIKPIGPSSGVVLPKGLLELGEWISSYYVCPLGVTLASMLPASVRRGVGRKRVTELHWTEPGHEGAPASLPPTAVLALEQLRASPGVLPAPARVLREQLGLKSVRPLNVLRESGVLEERVREVIAVREEASWARLREAYNAGDASPPPTPTHEQAAAISTLSRTLGSFGVHLLHGITGSGKTEVYLRLIEAALERNETAIVLVPEIALTPQTSERFIARLGLDRVAVLHSGLTAARRHAEWSRAACGEARVIVGARSAVFAPLPRLGVIVIDEEHDSTYKQDRAPRYHARAVAIKRGQIEGATVVLGSATPSMETWSLARVGRIGHLSLTSRATGAALPSVRVVDVSRDRSSSRNSIGPVLRTAIAETLDKGEQVLLLADRRGLSAALRCNRCDWTLRCESCDAAMVVHQARRAGARKSLRCHHCLAERVEPRSCPSCGGALSAIGAGTQHVERELAEVHGSLVPGATFARVDADTMQRASDYFDVLGRFARGELRLLVGTGMIAKGLDVPGVTLVGVVSADTSLAIPDFRADERTYQLVSQVAGRAGRAGAGRVIVQTLDPSAEAIRAAAQHEYVGFADRELARRRAAGFPPSTRLARVVCKDASEQAAEALAQGAADLLRSVGPDPDAVLGPMPCQRARLADRYRFEVLVRARSVAALDAAIREPLAGSRLLADTRVTVDVDPLHLL